VPVETPRIPVARNIDGALVTRADEVKPSLVAQVASPVRWTDCVHHLDRAGATVFLEVGPGRVLSGLLRRTLDRRRALPVEDRASLEAAVAAVAAGAGG
jgi:[acyl-carrier-protein] S-malonyltransferase